MRAEGLPTVPGLLGDEKRLNPFHAQMQRTSRLLLAAKMMPIPSRYLRSCVGRKMFFKLKDACACRVAGGEGTWVCRWSYFLHSCLPFECLRIGT